MPSRLPSTAYRLPPRGRKGMVLIVVLVAVAFLSLSAYTFTELMVAEHEGADVHGKALQAQALADSGVAWMGYVLAEDEATRFQGGGIHDNPERFQAIEVTPEDSPQGLGRFTILAPDVDESGRFFGARFGLEDESSRLNLNTLLAAESSDGAGAEISLAIDSTTGEVVESGSDGGRTLLMHLPGMTEDVADAILDWMDEDDDIRELGAEVEFYSGLDPPYAPKNGPLETVEELLLVRGVTPSLLFGADANRNYLVDAHEMSGVEMEGVDNSTGDMDRGWSAFLTLHSRENNLNPDGEPRFDLNRDDLEALQTELTGAFPPEWATFIIAYRQSGAYTGDAVSRGPASGELDLEKKGQQKLTSVLDLVGVRVQVRFKGADQDTLLESPFPDTPSELKAVLPELLDRTAVNAAAQLAGRINVNQASRPVLMTVPGMTDEFADAILAQRELELAGADSPQRHETWLLTEGLVPLEEMKKMLPYVCTGGDVYRAQAVGYFDESGPAARIEAVFDASAGTPRLLFWRDLTHLGRGWPLEVLGAGGAGGDP